MSNRGKGGGLAGFWGWGGNFANAVCRLRNESLRPGLLTSATHSILASVQSKTDDITRIFNRKVKSNLRFAVK
ncbi:hypothetical protein AGMMS50267_07760 [Spirochaetia bacterium]|nr:hypothetical protein AGMMS50267_07760 [Spirochaetia bacterium]